MAPKVTVPDANPESNDIEIGDYRTEGPDDPNAPRTAGAIEARSDAQGHDCM